jgi:CubicO group peptidase (beta-lactamase class C family)
MNRKRSIAALAAATVFAGVGTAAYGATNDWPTTEQTIPIHGDGAPGIDPSIDADVIAYLTENDLPGATVAVTRAGRLVWSKGYGWARKSEQRPMQPWHRSRIGSVSKIITTIGLLQVLEPQSTGGGLDDLIAPGSDLASQLSRKLYGYPGSDFHSPDWPNVTGPAVLANPEVYWEAIRTGVQNAYPDTYETEMAKTIKWASQLELRHLLTHTSGFILNGSAGEAADYFGDAWDGSYSQVHLLNLLGQRLGDEGGSSVKCWRDGEFYVDKNDPAYTGQDYVLPPLLHEPGTKRCYSNHGFGVAGLATEDLVGGGLTYPEIIKQNILDPLGLTNVVPRNVQINEELDAWPHGSSLNPNNVNLPGTAAGGWSASAQDVVRIMCGLDRASNNLRLLSPQTVTTMETVPFPAVKKDQPLGWDSISDNRLSKSGSTSGGKSLVIKYLPGKFATAPLDEINVAVNVNSNGAKPPASLLNSIATKVAAADIPDGYDLFDPAYACVVDPTRDLVAPTRTPTTPTLTPTPTPTPTLTRVAEPTAAEPNGTYTLRIGPTVTIERPYNGWQPAPNGSVKIPFHGWATDATGAAIPGTRLRWTAIEGGQSTVLCSGSDFGPAPTTGGIVVVTDCTQFERTFTNPRGGSGPSITIRLEAKDQGGLVGSAEVVIALYTPTN